MKTRFILILLLAVFLLSCQKEFLEKKPRTSLLVPSKLEDMQALLDNISIMNITPGLPCIAANEFIVVDNGLSQVTTVPERETYLWAKDPYQGATVSDWNVPYQQVFYANIVLDGLKKMEIAVQNTAIWREIKGNALFYRAKAFQSLASQFCKAYNERTAMVDLGIPLPLESDVNIRPGRGRLKNTYDRILQDLAEAESYLPAKVSIKNRPSRRAARMVSAQVYLSMGKFEEANLYAEKCLSEDATLIDFNDVKIGAFDLFPSVLPNNYEEIIFFSQRVAYGFYSRSVLRVEPSLFSLYHDNDLRKSVYYYKVASGATYFSGYYGLANDELYLISAESKIRTGQVEAGLQQLNTLLLKRYKNGTYIPFSNLSQDEAMRAVLNERRKELVWRGVRWFDAKRLNLEGKYPVTFSKTYNGINYILPPNDPRYVFPIPDDEIRESGIQQN